MLKCGARFFCSVVLFIAFFLLKRVNYYSGDNRFKFDRFGSNKKAPIMEPYSESIFLYRYILLYASKLFASVGVKGRLLLSK